MMTPPGANLFRSEAPKTQKNRFAAALRSRLGGVTGAGKPSAARVQHTEPLPRHACVVASVPPGTPRLSDSKTPKEPRVEIAHPQQEMIHRLLGLEGEVSRLTKMRSSTAHGVANLASQYLQDAARIRSSASPTGQEVQSAQEKLDLATQLLEKHALVQNNPRKAYSSAERLLLRFVELSGPTGSHHLPGDISQEDAQLTIMMGVDSELRMDGFCQDSVELASLARLTGNEDPQVHAAADKIIKCVSRLQDVRRKVCADALQFKADPRPLMQDAVSALMAARTELDALRPEKHTPPAAQGSLRAQRGVLLRLGQLQRQMQPLQASSRDPMQQLWKQQIQKEINAVDSAFRQKSAQGQDEPMSVDDAQTRLAYAAQLVQQLQRAIKGERLLLDNKAGPDVLWKDAGKSMERAMSSGAREEDSPLTEHLKSKAADLLEGGEKKSGARLAQLIPAFEQLDDTLATCSRTVLHAAPSHQGRQLLGKIDAFNEARAVLIDAHVDGGRSDLGKAQRAIRQSWTDLQAAAQSFERAQSLTAAPGLVFWQPEEPWVVEPWEQPESLRVFQAEVSGIDPPDVQQGPEVFEEPLKVEYVSVDPGAQTKNEKNETVTTVALPGPAVAVRI